MSGLFISYRRADREWTARLKDHLAMRFGEDLVWQDVDDIRAGSDWRKSIQKGIESADAVLIVIGPRWQQGNRLNERDSVLRMEIETALGAEGEVIPVLVGGAPLPERETLPASIVPLLKRQAAELPMADVAWDQGVQRLIEDLKEIVVVRRSRIPLPVLHQRLDRMQYAYFDALEGNPQKALPRDVDRALEISHEALRVLDDQAPLFPDDHYLKLMRGYWLKNRAMAQRDLGRTREFAGDLEEARRAFEMILRESEMATAGAYNGFGSVEMLRGRFEESLGWIERALELAPTYEAALHDRQTVLGLLGQTRG